jgi:hypothetical protein
VSTDRPDRPERDEPGSSGHEDAAWRDIIAHYGDRAELAQEDVEAAEDRDVRRPIPRPIDDPDRWVRDDADRPVPDEHYVPPPPPPLPRPTGARLLAWLGLFGSPTVMLVCLLAGVAIPSWGGVLLFFAFLGGFGYLVATMRKHDDSDPWDDGAVI